MQMLLSIVLPVLNEESNIRDCLNSMAERLPIGWPYEIILVDGNSTDKTMEEVRDFFGSGLHLVVKGMPRRGKHGYADAVNSGVDASSGKYIFVMDAEDRMIGDGLRDIFMELKKDDSPDVVMMGGYGIVDKERFTPCRDGSFLECSPSPNEIVARRDVFPLIEEWDVKGTVMMACIADKASSFSVYREKWTRDGSLDDDERGNVRRRNMKRTYSMDMELLRGVSERIWKTSNSSVLAYLKTRMTELEKHIKNFGSPCEEYSSFVEF